MTDERLRVADAAGSQVQIINHNSPHQHPLIGHSRRHDKMVPCDAQVCLFGLFVPVMMLVDLFSWPFGARCTKTGMWCDGSGVQFARVGLYFSQVGLAAFGSGWAGPRRRCGLSPFSSF